MQFFTIIGIAISALALAVVVVPITLAIVYEITGWHPNKNLDWYETR